MVLGALVGYVVVSAVFPTLLWTHVISIFLVAGLAMLLVDPGAAAKAFNVRLERLSDLRRRYIFAGIVSDTVLLMTGWIYGSGIFFILIYGVKLLPAHTSLQHASVALFFWMLTLTPAFALLLGIGRFFYLTDSASESTNRDNQIVDGIVRFKITTLIWNPIAAPFTVIFGIPPLLPMAFGWLFRASGTLVRYIFQNVLLASMAGFALGWLGGSLVGVPVQTALVATILFFSISFFIWVVDKRLETKEE